MGSDEILCNQNPVADDTIFLSAFKLAIIFQVSAQLLLQDFCLPCGITLQYRWYPRSIFFPPPDFNRTKKLMVEK